MGILNDFGVQNPFTDFIGNHRSALTNFGVGLANGQNLSQGIGLGTQGLATGAVQDTAYATSKKAEKDRQNAINKTAEYLKSNPAFADLVPLVEAGHGDAALTEAFSRINAKKQGHSYMNADGKIFDETTGQFVDPGAAGGGAPPTFDGTSMDAQVGNILLSGDPNTQAYAYAYSIASQPKITFQTDANGNQVPVYQTPDLSSVRKPTYQGNLPAPVPLAPPQSPAQAPQAGPIAAPAQQPQFAPPQASIAPQMPPIGNWGPDASVAPQAPVPTQTAPGLSVGTPLPGLGTKPNENQQRMGLLSNSLNTAAPEVLKGFDALSDPKQQILGIGGDLTKPWQSEEYQKATVALQSAISDIIPAISGAAFSENEIKEKINAFTPKLGEKPGTIAFKKQLFLSYVKGIANASSDPVAKQKAQEFLSGISPDASTNAPVDYKQKYGLD